MDFAPADRRDYVEQLAGQLAAIHGADYSQLDLSFLRATRAGCNEPRGDWPADEQLGEGRIRAAMEKHGPPQTRNAPALLHGDFWPGNALWREGELVAMVDWEDAMRGDPLIDLAQTRSEIAWTFGIEALEVFSDCYRATIDIEYGALPYWDLCALCALCALRGAIWPGWRRVSVPTVARI
ncbi:MAG: phosphotransferase [Candidatus Latescibacteria bacterium]|jgi:aminoglycoside phosphotransferase (APT) family kinase protein|nr:phosphotransferase [Candidatus Latescibacterota bacterium]